MGSGESSTTSGGRSSAPRAGKPVPQSAPVNLSFPEQASALPAAPDTLEYNPYAFSLHEDPYEIYRRLRDEQPAYWNPDLQFWALSRFEDVHAGFRDSVPYSSANGIALEARRQKSALPMMITLDPPEHTVMRKLVSRVFTPRGSNHACTNA